MLLFAADPGHMSGRRQMKVFQQCTEAARRRTAQQHGATSSFPVAWLGRRIPARMACPLEQNPLLLGIHLLLSHLAAFMPCFEELRDEAGFLPCGVSFPGCDEDERSART